LWVYFRAYNNQHKRKGMHIGPLTRTCREVLRALLWICNSKITRSVSYEAIAREAGCSINSVWRALTRLRGAGILTWFNRYAWNDRHRKVVRTMNQFFLLSNFENEEVGQTQELEEKEEGLSDVECDEGTTSDREIEAALGQLRAAMTA
jgi:hypothetical protein